MTVAKRRGGAVTKKGSSSGSYRSAISGRYVSTKVGKSRPKTTSKKKK
jgi:hypothetical protein